MKIQKYLKEADQEVQDIENAVLSTLDPQKRERLKNRATELNRLRVQINAKIDQIQSKNGDTANIQRLTELLRKIDKLLAGKTFADLNNNNNQESETDTDSSNQDSEAPDKELKPDDASETTTSSEGSRNDSDPESTPDKNQESQSDADNNDNNNDTADEQAMGQKKSNKDDPVADIFNRPENQRATGNPDLSKAQPRLPKINEIIKELSELSGDAKQGAIKALEDILGIKESLREAIEDQALEDISDEEYADFVNNIIDELQKDDDDITVSDDINKRKIDIKAELDNTMADRDLRTEIEKDAKKEKNVAKITGHSITSGSSYGKYRPVEQFFIDLTNTIRDQITLAEVEAQSYREINPEYEGENVIMKADVTDLVPKAEKPNIGFFFDMSGSWTYDNKAIELGKRFVASLKEFVDRGELNLDIYYFSDIVTNNPNDGRLGGGTSAWSKILDTIKANSIKNVVIMTDCDMESYAPRYSGLTIEGTVWYIWKLCNTKDEGGTIMPQKLRGMNGTRQYSFYV